VGTVQMREESESGIRKWEEMWFKTTAEDGERGGSSDVRWKTFADSGQTSKAECSRCNNQLSLFRTHKQFLTAIFCLVSSVCLPDCLQCTGLSWNLGLGNCSRLRRVPQTTPGFKSTQTTWLPAAQMGLAKSDFSQMCRSRSGFDYERGNAFRSDWSRSI